MVLRRVRNFMEAGQRMQAQAMAMHEAQTRQSPGGDNSADGWDPVRWLPAPSNYVKRVTCGSCGAPKQLATVREFLYCDFCGQLTDYDLRRATEAATTHPAITTYATIANQIGPQAERVRQAGDREHYRQLQHQLHTAQVDHTPWAVPPRAWKDAGYRQQWITFSSEVAVLCAFDPAQVAYTQQVTSRAQQLRWKGGMGRPMVGGMLAIMKNMTEAGADLTNILPKVEAISFWPLVEVVLEQAEHAQQLITAAGLRELDPDGSSPVVAERMAKSMLAQGWLRSLEDEDGQAFIERLGLSHQYQKASVGGDIRHCAGCGHDVTALPGATCVVCNGCGRRVDLATPQVVCTGCNARVAFIDGTTHVSCPYCAAEIRRT